MGDEVSPLLCAAAGKAVGASAGARVEVEGIRRESIDYDAFLPHRAVQRVSGLAATAGSRTSWSLIEKTTRGPVIASPYLIDNGMREFAFYASDVPADLAAAVRAPHVLGSAADPDGGITLWLEEVQHEGPRPLDSGTLLAAARDLGGLAGRWAQNVPQYPWLFTGWIDRHTQPGAIPDGLATLDRAAPAAIPRWGSRLGEARRLLWAQPRLRKILELLPQTLCHHDAVGANVFRSEALTVLIDWESVGPGPVGADLASLLFSSARRGDASAAQVAAIMDDAVDAYVDGLRTEADVVDVPQVRQGLDASIALRWKLAVDIASNVEHGEHPRRGSRPDEPPEQALDELSTLVDVLLGAARRALDE